MNDFFSSGWGIFIAAITLIGLLGCLVLLFATSNKKVSSAADNTTGHVWDDNLAELNNPMPRWWVGLFVITVIFALIYLWLYPGLGVSQGSLGWTAVKQYEDEKAKASEQLSTLYAGFMAKDAAALAQDPAAMGIGQRLFNNNCAACHGSNAQGSKGFPNLTDKDWLYGGDFEVIKTTITKGRQGNMPPMAAAVGNAEDVSNLANHVLSLSWKEGEPPTFDALKAQLGKPKFAACGACHGPEGKGNPALGAPNLTDKVWLHGWGEAAVTAMINGGKHNVMPAQEGRLTPEQIHVVAAYVWSLSNSAAAQKQ